MFFRRLQYKLHRLMTLHCTLPAGCDVTSVAEHSYFMVVSAAMGILVFALADALSSSIMFRLSCGTLAFVTGSLLILLVLLIRWVVALFGMVIAGHGLDWYWVAWHSHGTRLSYVVS